MSDADPVARQQWDGVPKIVVTGDQLMSLTAYCPQWVGKAIGPKIPFTNPVQHVVVDVNAMFKPRSREEALVALQRHMRLTCEDGGITYDEDDWTVVRLELVGGC